MKSEWIYGVHAVNAVLEQEPARFIEVFIQVDAIKEKRILPICQTLEQLGIYAQTCAKKTLEKKAATHRHQGIIARVKVAKVKNELDLEHILNQATNPLFLILDGVTDPHNLGACLRNADGAGVHAIIAPKDRSASINSTVAKVASGAAETVPFIQVTNLSRTLEWLKDQHVWIIGTTGETDKYLYDVDLKGATAIVMGAEGEGMRRLTTEKCDDLVKIPMAGNVSSLNVSVASGVCLYEAVRQRKLY